MWENQTRIEDPELTVFFQKKHFAKEWGINPLEFEKLDLKFVMMDHIYQTELNDKAKLKSQEIKGKR